MLQLSGLGFENSLDVPKRQVAREATQETEMKNHSINQ